MRRPREMAAAGCDIVVLGGVPINLSRGAQNAEQMLLDLEAELGVKVSSSTAAQTRPPRARLQEGGGGAALLEADTARIAGYAVTFGCELLGATGWGQARSTDRAHPAARRGRDGPQAMHEHPDADTLLLPSPHWPCAGAIDVLEREFGVNVVRRAPSRSCGTRCDAAASTTRSRGFGRLFAGVLIAPNRRSVLEMLSTRRASLLCFAAVRSGGLAPDIRARANAHAVPGRRIGCGQHRRCALDAEAGASTRHKASKVE